MGIESIAKIGLPNTTISTDRIEAKFTGSLTYAAGGTAPQEKPKTDKKDKDKKGKGKGTNENPPPKAKAPKDSPPLEKYPSHPQRHDENG